MDSVFRACISKLHKSTAHRTPYLLNFVVDKVDQYYLVAGLSELQMLRFCALQPSPKDALFKLSALVCRYPYASAKATLMESLRKRKNDYIRAGVPLARLKTVLKSLHEQSYDSEILTTICYPSVVAVL